MITTGNNKIWPVIFSLTKVLVVVVALAVLYFELSKKIESGSATDWIASLNLASSPLHIALILFAGILMLVNWGIEAVKWRKLIAKVEAFSLGRAYKAIWTGLTVSTFTPNRIGEYAGRVIFLKTENKLQATVITVVGNVSQLIVTILFGSMIGLWAISHYLFLEDPPVLLYLMLLAVGVLCNSMLVYYFLQAGKLVTVLDRIKWLQKWKKYYRALSWYSSGELAQVLLLSLLRYSVFTLQFFLLLIAFRIEIAWQEVLLLIPPTFLVMSVIPTIAITEFGVREVSAIAIFGVVTSSTLPVVAATFILWVINFVVPALFGSLFLLGVKAQAKENPQWN